MTRAERKRKPDVNPKPDVNRKPDVSGKYDQMWSVSREGGQNETQIGKADNLRSENLLLNCSQLRPPLSLMSGDRPVGCDSNDRYQASSLFCLASTSRVRLVVLVLSAARNYERRQEARTNWLRSRFLMTPQFIDNNAWAYAFVVGKSRGSVRDREITESNLEIESCHYRDILKVDVEEGYNNLTWKKLEAFKYLMQSGIGFEIVLKTDDDCYINIQLVLEWLPEAANKSYNLLKSRAGGRNLFYSGHCPPRGYPSRNPRSKWSVSHEEYKNTAYPAFCFGAGYFLSRDLLAAILNLRDLKETFHLEDVHMGVLVNDTGFFPNGDGITQALRVYNFAVGECGWRGERRYPLISSGRNFEYRLRVFHAFMNQTNC